MWEGYASKEVVNPVNITKKRITVSRIARVVFTGAINSSPKLFGGGILKTTRRIVWLPGSEKVR